MLISRGTLGCLALALVLSACPSHERWRTFKAGDGRFRVQVPSAVEVHAFNPKTTYGTAQVMSVVPNSNTDERGVNLVRAQLSAARVAEYGVVAIFDEEQSRERKGRSAKLDFARDATWQERPARRFQLSFEGGWSRHLLVADYDDVYHLMVYAPDQRAVEALAERFFPSFKLLHPARALPAAIEDDDPIEEHNTIDDEVIDQADAPPDAGDDTATPTPDQPRTRPDLSELRCPAQTKRVERKRADADGREWVCLRSDGKRDGPYAGLDRRGELRVHGAYSEDKRSGGWRFWRSNGELERELSFQDDLKTGLERAYDPVGKLQAVGRWRAGVREGNWIEYAAGRRVREISYRKGQKHGRETTWSIEGARLSVGEYRDDTKHGRWTFFHSSGHKAAEGEYSRGNKVGAWRSWDPRGRPKPLLRYQDGGVKVLDPRPDAKP